MTSINVKNIQRGMILPQKSASPVISVNARDDIQTVSVFHAGGYVWHSEYSDMVEIA